MKKKKKKKNTHSLWGSLEILIFTSIINSLLLPTTLLILTGCSCYGIVKFSSYLKQSLLNVIVFIIAVLNIKRFDTAMKHFHFKIRKNGDSVNLIVAIIYV